MTRLAEEAPLRHVVPVLLMSLCRLAMAETVEVKYHGPVSLEAFACADVREGSDVSRICYDAADRYMLIRLRSTYYHYCEIDAATVRALQTADSKRQYFEAHVRGSGSDGPFDCRTHPVPKRYRL
ncbi:KTSC domain-containing protein [Ideonella sp. YS5]|uniref:KTSC domain-containing protein n=1 Tax=Ideonella sp. YS5 TaxID=3453714 RepID=UPI003EED87AF